MQPDRKFLEWSTIHFLPMKTSLLRRIALLSVGATVALMLLPAVRANQALNLSTVSDKAKALPLTASIEKGQPGENGGHYAVKLKNTSHEALKVKATIIWSVASHNRANTINLPEHEIAAGGEWSISDLAAHDRVIVSAEGHANLEVTVTPPAK